MTIENSSEDKNSSEQGQFSIQKIYVKDISFETPNSPKIFQEQWQPVVNMDLANSATALDDKFFEVVLSITVTVSFKDQTVYLIEVEQAGIFHLSNLPPEAINRMLGTICPNILFPFAREVISNLVNKGGFPQLLLAPVNFDALYQRKIESGSGNKH
jgi:preprotein translocase subunit SecB